MARDRFVLEPGRIGILGGTFNPVHYGHLHLAETAVSLCSLQEILFIPAAVPPHKLQGQLVSFEHRVAMLQLALEDCSYCRLSTVESLLPAPSYTIDTLKYIENANERLQAVFIIGADAFLEIRSWKQYSEVLSMVDFLVFGRSGSKVTLIEHLVQKLGYQKDNDSWRNDVNLKTITIHLDELSSVSSSDIRRQFKNNLSVSEFTPSVVSDYIVANDLYLK